MKRIVIPALMLMLFGVAELQAQTIWDQAKKKAAEAYNKKNPKGTGLTNDDVIKGLKEALNVGVNKSTSIASKLNGYYKNPKIFIPWPADAVKVEKKLRELGFGKKVDEFTMTLNRAAEEAAKEAAPIFVSAIKGITIQDGMSILKGTETAATSYLKGKTESQLQNSFSPIVQRALQKTNATKYWSELVTIYNKLPTVQKINPNLNAYATDKAIDGLFVLVGDEETKIRKDPAARVSDILKKVFGAK